MLLRLIEEIGLYRLGLSLLPVTDTDPDEPHRLARQVAVKKKRPSLAQDHPFVVSRDWEFVLAGMGLETCETDLELHRNMHFTTFYFAQLLIEVRLSLMRCLITVQLIYQPAEIALQFADTHAVRHEVHIE